jgi:hypothetical protein
MAKNLGQLVIRGFNFLHQTGTVRHLPACYGPGIDRFRIIDDFDAPVPILEIYEKVAWLWKPKPLS